jgi:hypothetical protein
MKAKRFGQRRTENGRRKFEYQIVFKDRRDNMERRLFDRRGLYRKSLQELL